jgi:hypothetical protein
MRGVRELYMRKTNRMHLYLINLFQLNYSVLVLNEQVYINNVLMMNLFVRNM